VILWRIFAGSVLNVGFVGSLLFKTILVLDVFLELG
jgi:hypothetical protein